VAVVNDFGYEGVIEGGIALDEDRLIASGGEDLREERLDFALIEGGLLSL